MAWKMIAAAAVLACAAAPAHAWDTGRDGPHTMLFIKVPLDGRTAREQLPSWGFTLRTRADLPAFTFDSGTVQRFVHMGFVESQIILAGAAVAAAAVVAVGAGGGGSSSASPQEQQAAAQRVAAQAQQTSSQPAQQQAAQQQAAAQQAQQPAAPQPPAAPCPKKPAC